MLSFERKLFRSGVALTLGIDEVGRGSLAGPVVAAAVCFEKDFILQRKFPSWVSLVNDSKKLSCKTRDILNLEILKSCLSFGIGLVGPRLIDEINIHYATLLAMKKAISKNTLKLEKDKKILPETNLLVIVDGKFNVPELKHSQQAEVGADSKIFSVACASIVAKVYRDRFMKLLDKEIVGYGFAKHKGYGTKEHFLTIRKNGLSLAHRKTFCKAFVD